ARRGHAVSWSTRRRHPRRLQPRWLGDPRKRRGDGPGDRRADGQAGRWAAARPAQLRGHAGLLERPGRPVQGGAQQRPEARRLEVAHVAAGDALRAEVARGTELGARVAGFVDRGELVPDEVVVDLMTPVVAAAAEAGGYILDGFPRNLAKAHVADEAWEQRGI